MAFVDEEVRRTGHFLASIVNECMTAARERRVYKMDEKEMKLLKRATESYERRMKRHRV